MNREQSSLRCYKRLESHQRFHHDMIYHVNMRSDLAGFAWLEENVPGCSMWVPATPAKVPRRFHYTYLPNAVILATSRSKKVTHSCFQSIPNGFLWFFQCCYNLACYVHILWHFFCTLISYISSCSLKKLQVPLNTTTQIAKQSTEKEVWHIKISQEGVLKHQNSLYKWFLLTWTKFWFLLVWY